MRGCSADVDFPKLSRELFGLIPSPLDAGGVIRNVFVGYSLDSNIRSLGSSGGVVTELLLYLLRRGVIDQALVCGMNKHRPLEPNPILARTEQDIIRSAQSKYTIVPQMRLIKKIIKSRRKTAIVGVPCQIHAYRKFESWYERISRKVPLVIGLACHSTLEIQASEKLLAVNKINMREVMKLEYRGGDSWPGGIQVTLANGNVKRLHGLDIKSAFNRLNLFYTPDRCLTCIDHTNELSDLSVMDPWIRGRKGQHPYRKGHTLILARNDKAHNILGQAVSDGSLFLEEIPQSILPTQLAPMVKKKKIGAAIRIEKLKKGGKPFPKYNIHFPEASFKDRVDQELDSIKRVFGRWKWSRNLFMRLAFSRFGDFLMLVKSFQKKHMFALRHVAKQKGHQ
jgi:coenzyme F420 hydrogenase subunit beta